MTYKEFIDNILETRGRFGCEGYKERHHIIPKCMGGTNDETNLIDLYAREHFDAHKMLAEENPDNKKLFYAYWRMCVTKKGDICTADEYEVAKERCARMSSQLHKGRKWSTLRRKTLSEKRKGSGNPMYGKRLSEEHKMKLITSRKGAKQTEETKQKIREAHIGKTHSDESKKKVSIANMGRPCSKEAKIACSKPVVAIDKETDKIMFVFNSMSDGGRWCNVAVQSICACCKGQRKTAGGYKWKYVNKENIE